jgi:hypothetical protein
MDLFRRAAALLDDARALVEDAATPCSTNDVGDGRFRVLGSILRDLRHRVLFRLEEDHERRRSFFWIELEERRDPAATWKPRRESVRIACRDLPELARAVAIACVAESRRRSKGKGR